MNILSCLGRALDKRNKYRKPLATAQCRHTSKDHLSALSFNRRDPELVYVRNHSEANEELSQLLRKRANSRVVGFDVEWRPVSHSGLPENPVALVQIAAVDRILLLQLSAMEVFPTKLIEFMKDESILKAGVNILGDAQRMYRDCGTTMRSCVELSHLARALDRDRWPGKSTDLIGLSRLVHRYTGHSLPKNILRRSDWEAPLTQEQIDYAANDAFASLAVCIRLLKRAHHLDRSLFMFDVVHANAVHTMAVGQPWEAQAFTPPSPPLAIRSRATQPETSTPTDTHQYTLLDLLSCGGRRGKPIKDKDRDVLALEDMHELIRVQNSGTGMRKVY